MPQYPHPVRISTPGTSTTDPVTGNQVAGPMTTVTTRAWLAQKPVGVLAAAAELNAGQDTVISLATILVPPGTVLTADSTVVDVAGAVNGQPGVLYRVEGQPADRYSGAGRRIVFRAAALRLISDMQE